MIVLSAARCVATIWYFPRYPTSMRGLESLKEVPSDIDGISGSGRDGTLERISLKVGIPTVRAEQTPGVNHTFISFLIQHWIAAGHLVSSTQSILLSGQSEDGAGFEVFFTAISNDPRA